MSAATTLFFRCIPELVTFDPDLHPYASHLFTCIAHKAYLNSGKVQMTTAYLAQISKLSEKTVQRYLPQLEEKGYLKVHRAPKGSKIPNIYEIIGLVAEIVIRRSKTEMEQASAAPWTRANAVPQRTERPSTQNPDSISTLKAQSSESPSTTINRPPDRHDDLTDVRSMASQTPDQQSDRPTTKQEEKTKNPYEESSVVEEPFNQELPFSVPGVRPSVMQGWINTYTINRVREVIEAMSRQKNIGNKGAWIRSALENGWEFGQHNRKSSQNGADKFLNDRYAWAYANNKWKSES